jgi:hypothetical protein
MKLFSTWFYGYFKINKTIENLKTQNSPLLGLVSSFVRAVLNSLILFLPIYLTNHIPAMPPYITFIDKEHYFLFLTIIIPFLFIFQWLFLSGVIYLILRLSGKKTNFDHILNIFGIVSLIVGSFLIIWDWIWVLLNSDNYILLGISHLIIDIWAIILTTKCLNRIMGIKIGFGIILNIIWIILSLPLAILLMRSPL